MGTLYVRKNGEIAPVPGVYVRAQNEGSPDGGIVPSGTLGITANGTYDVTQYAKAAVAVSAKSDTSDIPAGVVAEAERVSSSILSKMGSNSVTFVAISDMHVYGDSDQKDPAVMERFRKANKNAGQGAWLVSKNIPLDFCANLGDYCYGSKNDSFTTSYHDWAQSIVAAKGYIERVRDNTQVIEIPGNHDVLFDIRGEEDTDATNKRPYITNDLITGIIGNYRYVDIDSKKVRVIALNTAEFTAGYSSTARMSGEQLQWFANALDLSAKADASQWGIIILSHHPLDWSGLENAVGVLKSYLAGSSYSVTHNSVAVSYNFTGKNMATVIANFHGHIHCFTVANIADTEIQRIAIPNACYGRNNEYGYDKTTYHKSPSDGKNTAFCVVSIDLTTKWIYADCFGAGCDRDVSYGGADVVTYTITNNLTNVTSSNGARTISDGSPYVATITANNGYELESVVITMGGKDITSTAYSNGNINIASVTGNVVITAKAKAVVVYDVTNLVSTSQEQNSTAVYNEVGYKNGIYASESGDGTDSACVATGWIPYTWSPDNVIYVRGASITSASHVRFFGWVNKTSVNSNAYATGANLSNFFTVEEIETGTYYKLTPLNTVPTVEYIRISLIGTGENLIVTVNEEIE